MSVVHPSRISCGTFVICVHINNHHRFIRVRTILNTSKAPALRYSSSEVDPKIETKRTRQIERNTSVETSDTTMKGIGGTAPLSAPRRLSPAPTETSHDSSSWGSTAPLEVVASRVYAPNIGLKANQLATKGKAAVAVLTRSMPERQVFTTVGKNEVRG